MPRLRHFALLAVAVGVLVFLAVLAVARPVLAAPTGPPTPTAPRAAVHLPVRLR